MRTKKFVESVFWIVAAIALLAASMNVRATEIQDIVRLQGAEKNTLVGYGLVFGLKGTGDGGKYRPAMESLARTMNTLLNEKITAADLKDAKNVALVTIHATIPASGARSGDEIDVTVASAGGAKSLEGGMLMMTPLTHISKKDLVFAYASGRIVLEDKEVPTGGTIPKGARMTKNVWSHYYDKHYRITLNIDAQVASWPVAHAIAQRVNDEFRVDDQAGLEIAKAIDQKNVIVAVPGYERDNPSLFINRILTAYIDPSMINTPARVVINEKTGTIVITGDVRISPVGIAHQGFTFSTVTPKPIVSARNPEVTENSFLQLDPNGKADPQLTDLINAFNLLKVNSEDRIAIIKAMNKSGQLHAKLIINE